MNHANKNDTNLQLKNTGKPLLKENLSLAENFHRHEDPNFKFRFRYTQVSL
jgi:hypothetical protein